MNIENIESAIYSQDFNVAKDKMDSINPETLAKAEKAQFYFLMAKYHQEENYDDREASRFYKKSIDVDETNIYARKAKNNLANIISGQGNESTSRRLWEEAGCPEYAKPFVNLSTSYNNELVEKGEIEPNELREKRISKKIREYNKKVVFYKNGCTQENIYEATAEIERIDDFLEEIKRREDREAREDHELSIRSMLRKISKPAPVHHEEVEESPGKTFSRYLRHVQITENIKKMMK